MYLLQELRAKYYIVLVYAQTIMDYQVYEDSNNTVLELSNNHTYRHSGQSIAS